MECSKTEKVSLPISALNIILRHIFIPVRKLQISSFSSFLLLRCRPFIHFWQQFFAKFIRRNWTLFWSDLFFVHTFIKFSTTIPCKCCVFIWQCQKFFGTSHGFLKNLELSKQILYGELRWSGYITVAWLNWNWELILEFVVTCL